MTGLWEVSSLFVCLMLSKINAVTSIIYVESGKSVIINPNIQGNPEEISWRFNGNKLAECDLTDLQDYGQFKGRSEIEITTGQLTVGNMTSRDSGTYVSEIQIVGKPQVETSQHQVQVIDAVQQPNVSCKLNKTSESKTLICSESSHSQNVSYEWTGSNSAHRFGQELQISQDAEPDSVYMCTARNPVSQKSTSITLRSCSTVDQTGQNVILYIILGVIGAIGVGIVTFLCIRQRKKDLRRAGVNTEDDRDDSFEGSQLHLSNTRNTSNTLHVNQEDQAFIQPVEVRGHVSNEEDDDDDDDDDDDNDDEDEDTDRKKDDELENNSKERKTEDEDDEKNEGLEKGDSENTNETSGHADEPTEAGGDADAEDEDEQDNNDGRSDDGPDD